MWRPLIITVIFYCCIFLLLPKNFISYLHPIILHSVIALLWCHSGVTPVLVLVLLRCWCYSGVTPVSLLCWCYSGVTPVLVLLRCHCATPVSLRCWCYSGVNPVSLRCVTPAPGTRVTFSTITKWSMIGWN